MTKRKDTDKKPAIEELDAAELKKVSAGTQRKLTKAEELRLKEQHAMGPEGSDIGSGAITSPKK